MPTLQARSFLFTSYNISRPPLTDENIRYMIYQKQRSTDRGEYWRGYAQMYNKTTWRQFLSIIGDDKAEVEVPSGDGKHLDESLCIDGPYEIGEPSKRGRPSKKDDLQEQKWIYEMLVKGWTIADFQ